MSRPTELHDLRAKVARLTEENEALRAGRSEPALPANVKVVTPRDVAHELLRGVHDCEAKGKHGEVCEKTTAAIQKRDDIWQAIVEATSPAAPRTPPVRLRDDKQLRAIVDGSIPPQHNLADAGRGFVVSEILDALERAGLTRTPPTDPVEAVLAVECPVCKQPPGKRCLPVGPYPNRDELVCASRIRQALTRGG